MCQAPSDMGTVRLGLARDKGGREYEGISVCPLLKRNYILGGNRGEKYSAVPHI